MTEIPSRFSSVMVKDAFFLYSKDSVMDYVTTTLLLPRFYLEQ